MYQLDLTPYLETAGQWRPPLADLYRRVPDTTCQRRTDCCANMPEIEAVEFLNLYLTLRDLDPEERERRLVRTVIYYFSNASFIQPCPWLEGRDCLIYDQRPLSCRAYGLWSEDHYQAQVQASRRAKEHLAQTWQGLGIKLPHEVINFTPPYCRSVKTVGQGIDDQGLLDVGAELAALGRRVFDTEGRWSEVYYNDFSFALTALVLGYQRALQQKVLITRELIKLDDSPNLRLLLPEAEKYRFL
ncbi:MAG: YkgJ family cysteine cluster protein [Proteobacteria bacterium]|nr:YkgJ family cysteine cluster protein [Pseudomonadota bacterium]MBU1739960.1 YkgJ family cysteine cluster protein [Pseudomonadota bacterium]